ncbi:glycosyltransferase, partial [Paenibacillus sp. F4]|uniref:glycosyltransferase family 2 protein n=5 Tax=Paenibacillus TaxID=44249 RepID=UPI000CB40BA9
MNGKVIISVIVPVYNVEKYLRKCLESLVNQTMENIEIIVVDDGSTDQSSEIIKEYKEAHPDKIVSLT